MAITAVQLFTTQVTCVASTSATRISSSLFGKDFQSLMIQAKNSNAATLYISGQSNATRSGFPLTKGQALDIGPVPMGGKTWYGVDPSSIYVWSTTGNAQVVIFHYLARNNS